MAGESGVRDGTILLERLIERVKFDWRLAIVRALTEPMRDDEHLGASKAVTPIEIIAERAVAEAWPRAESVLRPLFESLVGEDRFATQRATGADPVPTPAPKRPAVWLSAEEAAPLVGITAYPPPAGEGREEPNRGSPHGRPLVVLARGRRKARTCRVRAPVTP